MTAVIAYIIAALSITALLALWFFNAYQVISRKMQDMMYAEEQVRLHREGCRKMRGSFGEPAAVRMLEISEKIYLQTEESYRKMFRKPIYGIPGFLMGFNTLEKKTAGEKRRGTDERIHA